jgi:tetratricopeptide (TPR) repeat protein
VRISWLTADEIALAREALTAGGATYADHFVPEFRAPPEPANSKQLEWEHLTEHVARAERVSEVVRAEGIAAARARYGESPYAIEAATVAAAAFEGEQLDLDVVRHVLRCPIDSFVFYAHFLELLIERGRGDLDQTVELYERFASQYHRALAHTPHGIEKASAVRDGLADFYVSAGRFDAAEALFEKRHDEDQNDVAVALTASRAFLAAGSASHAVRWLGVGAARAQVLGRTDLEAKLREKLERIRERLS